MLYGVHISILCLCLRETALLEGYGKHETFRVVFEREECYCERLVDVKDTVNVSRLESRSSHKSARSSVHI